MMPWVPERMASNSSNRWTVLPSPPCRVTLGPVSLSFPDFGLEGASLTFFKTSHMHTQLETLKGVGLASAQGLIAKIR